MNGLRNDAYVRRFWPSCPKEVIDLMETQVALAADGNPDPLATDAILHEACECEWYKKASPSGCRQFHCLVGHVVLIARDYVVARTPSGRPRTLRSKFGPHRTFTMQVPRRAAS
jgi:hypothetical protein